MSVSIKNKNKKIIKKTLFSVSDHRDVLSVKHKLLSPSFFCSVIEGKLWRQPLFTSLTQN